MIGTIILIFLLLVSVGINIFLVRKGLALQSLVSSLWTYIKTIQSNYTSSLSRINEIDRLGAFKSDDDVGYIFNFIKDEINSLDSIINQYTDNAVRSDKSS